MRKKTLLFLVNADWFFESHRLPIALKAIEEGYDVHLACTFSKDIENFSRYGIKTHAISIDRSKTRLLSEFKTIIDIYAVLNRVKPDIFHAITIKAVLYGGLVSRVLKIKRRIFSISGLGYVFVSNGFFAFIRKLLVSFFYRLVLKCNGVKVIFQNPDDRDTFLNARLIQSEQVEMIKGSGVDLQEYVLTPEPVGVPVVTMAARLLRDKGIYEFLEAAKFLHKKGVSIRYNIVGDIDLGNPSSLTASELVDWGKYPYINVMGFQTDIAHIFAKSNIIVLPSYREGLPRVLSEAAACGRAVITTDVPGCRDAIVSGKTGILVPVMDVDALANAIELLVVNTSLRQSMGVEGRKWAEAEFSIDNVVKHHLKIYQ